MPGRCCGGVGRERDCISRSFCHSLNLLLSYLLVRPCCSFNKLLLQKEELEQKHLHLLQIVESEKTAKWQYTQQCEELAFEIKKLRSEVSIRLRVFRSNYYM